MIITDFVGYKMEGTERYLWSSVGLRNPSEMWLCETSNEVHNRSSASVETVLSRARGVKCVTLSDFRTSTTGFPDTPKRCAYCAGTCLQVLTVVGCTVGCQVGYNVGDR